MSEIKGKIVRLQKSSKQTKYKVIAASKEEIVEISAKDLLAILNKNETTKNASK